MEESKSRITLGGITLPSLLTIVFVVLKLCRVIGWSWLWVLSPLWISFGLSIILGFIFIVITVLLNDR